MASAKAELAQIGYTAYSSTAATAPYSMATAQAGSDAVWVAYGHGGPGVMEFYTMTGLYQSWLLSSSGSWNALGCGSPNDCISDYPSPAVSRMKLMVFGGCDTAQTSSTGASYRNLLDAARGVGVDNAIGFGALISWPAMDTWSARFWDDLSTGTNLQNSADDAAWYTLITTGQYYGTASLIIRGSGSAVMKPAAYGS